MYHLKYAWDQILDVPPVRLAGLEFGKKTWKTAGFGLQYRPALASTSVPLTPCKPVSAWPIDLDVPCPYR
jgi:hypothetical protein